MFEKKSGSGYKIIPPIKCCAGYGSAHQFDQTKAYPTSLHKLLPLSQYFLHNPSI
jgi:hypothetical protein